jgi:hypothetical protein
VQGERVALADKAARTFNRQFQSHSMAHCFVGLEAAVLGSTGFLKAAQTGHLSLVTPKAR